MKIKTLIHRGRRSIKLHHLQIYTEQSHLMESTVYFHEGNVFFIKIQNSVEHV